MGWYKLAGELSKGMLGSSPVVFDRSWVDRFDVMVERFAYPENLRRIERMPSRLPFDGTSDCPRVIHCAVAKYLVDWYRGNNRPIVESWANMESIVAAMLDEGDGETPFGPNECMRVGRHHVVLPNGLQLYYRGLKASESGSGFSYMGGPVGKEKKHLYGGKMAENIVQALARVVVYEQAVNIRRKHGLRFVLTSHDELVYCVPDAEAEDTLDLVLEEMRTAPPWAAGLPLNAEGGIGTNYGDAKG